MNLVFANYIYRHIKPQTLTTQSKFDMHLGNFVKRPQTQTLADTETFDTAMSVG